MFLLHRAMRDRGTVDADLRGVLEAMIRTSETLSSGLIYETLPQGLAGDGRRPPTDPGRDKTRQERSPPARFDDPVTSALRFRGLITARSGATASGGRSCRDCVRV